MELWLRKNKQTISIISVLLAGIGIVLSYLSLRDGQRAAAAGAEKDKQTMIAAQEQTRDDLKKLLYERGNNEMTALRMVTEYAQGLNGYVYAKETPEEQKKTPGPKPRGESKDAAKWFADTPSSMRSLYTLNFSRFELNNSAIESVRALIRSLMTMKPSPDESPEEKSQLRRYAELVIAPQLTAKAQSFDPTVRSAALVLCAELFNGSGKFDLLPKDYDAQAVFSGKFLGLTTYPKDTPLNLSGFNLSDSDFYDSHLFAVNLSQATISGASFDSCDVNKCIFDGVNPMASDSPNEAELKSIHATSFKGATLRDLAEVKDAKLFNADFSNAKLWNISFAASKLSGANFSQVTVLEPQKSQDGKDVPPIPHTIAFRYCALVNGKFSGSTLPSIVFENCDLSRARFEAIPAKGTEPAVPVILKAGKFINCVMQGAHFESADLVAAEFTGAENNDMNCRSCQFGTSAPDFDHVDLSGAYLADFPKAALLLKTLKSGKIDYTYLPSDWFTDPFEKPEIKLSESALALLVTTTRDDKTGVVATRTITNVLQTRGKQLQPSGVPGVLWQNLNTIDDKLLPDLLGVYPEKLTEEIRSKKKASPAEYYAALFKTHEPSLDLGLK